LEKIGDNIWTCTSSAGYSLRDFAGGPSLEVEISCERPEERWTRLHDKLHSFIEDCVREIVNDINKHIDSQRRYFDKDEEWRPAAARRQLTVTARDGGKCTFEVAITLTLVDIPNKVRSGICHGIANTIKEKFVPAHFIV
jgi:hypothetical protein